MRDYRTHTAGLDVLGGEQATNRAILIRVRNADELARSQGSIASFAQSLAPATLEAKVYDAIATELKDALTAKHVDVDVKVVEPAGWEPADGKHIWSDVAIGLGAVGVVAIVWSLFTRAGGHK